MKEPKLYCPFCELELNGCIHKNEDEAWGRFNCEYSTKANSEKPIPEMIIKKKRLAHWVEERKKTNKIIKKLQARIKELG